VIAGDAMLFVAEQQRLRQREREAVADFLSALRADDSNLGEALDALSLAGAWRSAMRAIVKGPRLSQAARRRFSQTLLADWDSMRSAINDDLLFTSALRSLLPPYRGGARTLFRGDSARSRQRRTYGFWWTSSVEVARAQANSIWRTFDGGSVILRTHAPAAAISCAPSRDC
jgi:hypothetical protein